MSMCASFAVFIHAAPFLLLPSVTVQPSWMTTLSPSVGTVQFTLLPSSSLGDSSHQSNAAPTGHRRGGFHSASSNFLSSMHVIDKSLHTSPGGQSALPYAYPVLPYTLQALRPISQIGILPSIPAPSKTSPSPLTAFPAGGRRWYISAPV